MSNPSIKTSNALKILKSKKMDLFAWVVIIVFVATFVVFEWSLILTAYGKLSRAIFLEFNGVAFTMFGALWTALGVRVSPKEKEALLQLKKNSGVVTEELIHMLSVASRFATFGAWFILIGGILLCAKVVLFH